jgi:hypothetical protein
LDILLVVLQVLDKKHRVFVNWPISNIKDFVIVKKILFFIFVFVLISGCKKESSSQSSQFEPYEQWHSLGLHNYTIDQSRSCFCFHAGELVRVTVRSDTVASVIRISDTSIVTYPFYCTVDGLFKIIQEHSYDSIVVRYNTRYGYPEYMDVDPQSHPVDGGFEYATSNLQIP